MPLTLSLNGADKTKETVEHGIMGVVLIVDRDRGRNVYRPGGRLKFYSCLICRLSALDLPDVLVAAEPNKVHLK